MNMKEFHGEAAAALGTADETLLREFVEKWVPIVTNTVTTLKQEKSFLELQLTSLEEQ